MWSGGLVLKPIEKTLFLSSLATCRYSAPVFLCSSWNAVSCNSGTCFLRLSVNPCVSSPSCKDWSGLARDVNPHRPVSGAGCVRYGHDLGRHCFRSIHLDEARNISLRNAYFTTHIVSQISEATIWQLVINLLWD